MYLFTCLPMTMRMICNFLNHQIMSATQGEYFNENFLWLFCLYISLWWWFPHLQFCCDCCILQKIAATCIMRRPIYIAGSIFWRLCLLVVTTASFSQNVLRLLLGKGRENSRALSSYDVHHVTCHWQGQAIFFALFRAVAVKRSERKRLFLRRRFENHFLTLHHHIIITISRSVLWVLLPWKIPSLCKNVQKNKINLEIFW